MKYMYYYVSFINTLRNTCNVMCPSQSLDKTKLKIIKSRLTKFTEIAGSRCRADKVHTGLVEVFIIWRDRDRKTGRSETNILSTVNYSAVI